MIKILEDGRLALMKEGGPIIVGEAGITYNKVGEEPAIINFDRAKKLLPEVLEEARPYIVDFLKEMSISCMENACLIEHRLLLTGEDDE